MSVEKERGQVGQPTVDEVAKAAEKARQARLTLTMPRLNLLPGAYASGVKSVSDTIDYSSNLRTRLPMAGIAYENADSARHDLVSYGGDLRLRLHPVRTALIGGRKEPQKEEQATAPIVQAPQVPKVKEAREENAPAVSQPVAAQSVRTAVPLRTRGPGEIAENDFLVAQARLKEMKAPTELIGAVIRARELIRAEPERAAAILSLAEMFMDSKSALKPSAAIASLDGLGQLPDPAIMEPMDRLIKLTTRIADPAAAFDRASLDRMKAEGGEIAGISAEFGEIRSAGQDRAANALRMGTDKLAETYTSSELPAPMKSRMANAITDARDLADRIDRGGPGMPSEKEIEDTAMRLALIRSMASALAKIQNPVLRSDIADLQVKAYDLHREKGDCPQYQLILISIKEIEVRGSDSAYKDDIIKNVNAMLGHKGDQARFDKDAIVLQGAIAKKVASEIEKASAGFGDEMKKRLGSISTMLRSGSIDSSQLDAGLLALDVAGNFKRASSIPAEYRAGVDSIYARAFESILNRDMEGAKAQLALANLFIGKSKTQREEIERFSQRIQKDPPLARHVGLYAGLDEAASGMRTATGKIPKTDKERIKTVSFIASELERTKTAIAEGRPLYSAEELEEIKNRIKADPQKMEKVQALASQRGTSFDDALELAASMALTAIAIERTTDLGAIGSLLLRLPDAKSESDKAIATILQMAADRITNGDSAGARLLTDAARIYFETKNDKDRKGIIEVCKRLNGSQLSPELAEEALGIYKKKAESVKKIPDAKARANATQLYDLSIKALLNGDASGSQTLSDMAAIYASWASTPEQKLGKDEKEKRKSVMAFIEGKLSSCAKKVDGGETLATALGGEDKLAKLDESIDDMDADRFRLDAAKRIDALNHRASEKSWKPKRDGLEKKAEAARAKGDDIAADYFARAAEDIDASLISRGAGAARKAIEGYDKAISDTAEALKEYERHLKAYESLMDDAKKLEDQAKANKGTPREKALLEKAAARRAQAEEEKKLAVQKSDESHALLKEADRLAQQVESILSGLEALDKNVRTCNTRHNELPIAPLANGVRLSIAITDGYDADYRGFARMATVPGEAVRAGGGEKAKAGEEGKPQAVQIPLRRGRARYREMVALERASYQLGHAEARRQDQIQSARESGVRSSKEQILDAAVNATKSQIRSMLGDYSSNKKVREWALTEAKARGVLDAEAAVDRLIAERKGGYQTRMSEALRKGDTAGLRSILQEMAKDMGIRVALPNEKPEEMKEPGIVLDPHRDGTEAFDKAKGLWYSENFRAAGDFTRSANSNVRSLGVLSGIAITDSRVRQNHDAVVADGVGSQFVYGSMWARDPENYSSPVLLGQAIEYVENNKTRDDLRGRLKEAEELAKDPSKASEAKAKRQEILRDLSSLGQGAIEGNVSPTTGMPLTIGIEGIAHNIATGSMVYWDARKRWSEGIGIRNFVRDGGSVTSANAMLDTLEGNIDRDAARQEGDTQRIGYVLGSHRERIEREREKARLTPAKPEWDNNAPSTWEAAITKYVINKGIGVANFIPGLVNIVLPSGYTIPKIETFTATMDAKTKYKYEKREADRIERQYTPIIANMERESVRNVDQNREAAMGLSDSIHAVGRSGRFFMSDSFQMNMLDNLPEGVRKQYADRMAKANQIKDKEEKALEIDRIWRDAAANHGSDMIAVAKTFTQDERMSEDELIQVRGRIVCGVADKANTELRAAKERIKKQIFIANVADSKLQAMEYDPAVESDVEKRHLRDGLRRMRDEALATAADISKDPHNLPKDNEWWHAHSSAKQTTELFEVLLRDSNIPKEEKVKLSAALGLMHADLDLLMGGKRRLGDGSIADVKMSQTEWEMASKSYEQFSLLESDLMARLANPGYQATGASDLSQINILKERMSSFHNAAFTVARASGGTREERQYALTSASRQFNDGAPKVKEGWEYKEKDRATLDAYAAADKTVSNKAAGAELAETGLVIAGFATGGVVAMATGGYLALGKFKEAGAIYHEAGGFNELTNLEMIDIGFNVAIGIAMFAGPVVGEFTKGFAEESALARMSGNATAAARYEGWAARSGALGTVIGHSLVLNGSVDALSSMPQILEDFSSGKASIFATIARTYSSTTMIVPGLHTLSSIRRGGGAMPRRISKAEYTARAMLGENPWHIREANIEAGQAKRAQDIARLESSPAEYAAHLNNVRDAVNNGRAPPPLTTETAVREAALVDSVAANKAAARGRDRPGAHLRAPELPTQKDYQDAAREVADAAPAMRRIREAARDKDNPMAQKVKENADRLQGAAQIMEVARPKEERGKDPLLDRKNAEDRAVLLIADEAKNRSDPQTHAARIKDVAAKISGKQRFEATTGEIAEAKLAIELAEHNKTDIEAAAKDIARIYAAGGEELLIGIGNAMSALKDLKAVSEGKEGEVSAKALADAFAWLDIAKKAIGEHPELFSDSFKKGVESLGVELKIRAKEIGFNLEDTYTQESPGNVSMASAWLYDSFSSSGAIQKREGGPKIVKEPGQEGDIVIVEPDAYRKAKDAIREREKAAKDEKDPDFNLSRNEFKYSKAVREELAKMGYKIGQDTIVQIGERENGNHIDNFRVNNTIMERSLENTRKDVATKGEGNTVFDALNSATQEAVDYASRIFGEHATVDIGVMMLDKGKTWMSNLFRDFGNVAMKFYFKAHAELSAEFGPGVVVKLAPTGSDEVVVVMTSATARLYAGKHLPEFYHSLAEANPTEFGEYAKGKGGTPTEPGALAKMKEDFGRDRFGRMDEHEQNIAAIDFAQKRYIEGMKAKMTGFAKGAGFREGTAMFDAMTAASAEKTQATATIDIDVQKGSKKVTFKRGNREYDSLEVLLGNTETRKMIDNAEKAANAPQSDAVWSEYAQKDSGERVRDDMRSSTREERSSVIAALKMMARLDRGREGETVPRLPQDVVPDMVFAVRGAEFQGIGQKALRLMALMAGKGAHNVEEQILGPSTVNLFGHGCTDAFDLFALNLRDALRLAGIKDTDVTVYKAGAMGYAIKFKENMPMSERARLEHVVLEAANTSKKKTYNDLQERWKEAKGQAKGPDKEFAPDTLPFQEISLYAGRNREAIDRMLDGDMFYGRSSRGKGNQMPDDLNHAMRVGLTIGHLAGNRAAGVLGAPWTGVRLPTWARQPADFRSIGKEEPQGLTLLDSALRSGAKPKARPAAPVQAPQPAEKAREGAEPGGTLRQRKPAAKEKREAIPAQRTGTDNEPAPAAPKPAPRAPQAKASVEGLPPTKVADTTAPAEASAQKEAPKPGTDEPVKAPVTPLPPGATRLLIPVPAEIPVEGGGHVKITPVMDNDTNQPRIFKNAQGDREVSFIIADVEIPGSGTRRMEIPVEMVNRGTAAKVLAEAPRILADQAAKDRIEGSVAHGTGWFQAILAERTEMQSNKATKTVMAGSYQEDRYRAEWNAEDPAKRTHVTLTTQRGDMISLTPLRTEVQGGEPVAVYRLSIVRLGKEPRDVEVFLPYPKDAGMPLEIWAKDNFTVGEVLANALLGETLLFMGLGKEVSERAKSLDERGQPKGYLVAVKEMNAEKVDAGGLGHGLEHRIPVQADPVTLEILGVGQKALEDRGIRKVSHDEFNEDFTFQIERDGTIFSIIIKSENWAKAHGLEILDVEIGNRLKRLKATAGPTPQAPKAEASRPAAPSAQEAEAVQAPAMAQPGVPQWRANLKITSEQMDVMGISEYGYVPQSKEIEFVAARDGIDVTVRVPESVASLDNVKRLIDIEIDRKKGQAQPSEKAREGIEPGKTLQERKPAANEEAVPLQRTGTEDMAPARKPAAAEAPKAEAPREGERGAPPIQEAPKTASTVEERTRAGLIFNLVENNTFSTELIDVDFAVNFAIRNDPAFSTWYNEIKTKEGKIDFLIDAIREIKRLQETPSVEPPRKQPAAAQKAGPAVTTSEPDYAPLDQRFDEAQKKASEKGWGFDPQAKDIAHDIFYIISKAKDIYDAQVLARERSKGDDVKYGYYRDAWSHWSMVNLGEHWSGRPGTAWKAGQPEGLSFIINEARGIQLIMRHENAQRQRADRIIDAAFSDGPTPLNPIDREIAKGLKNDRDYPRNGTEKAQQDYVLKKISEKPKGPPPTPPQAPVPGGPTTGEPVSGPVAGGSRKAAEPRGGGTKAAAEAEPTANASSTTVEAYVSAADVQNGTVRSNVFFADAAEQGKIDGIRRMVPKDNKEANDALDALQAATDAKKAAKGKDGIRDADKALRVAAMKAALVVKKYIELDVIAERVATGTGTITRYRVEASSKTAPAGAEVMPGSVEGPAAQPAGDARAGTGRPPGGTLRPGETAVPQAKTPTPQEQRSQDLDLSFSRSVAVLAPQGLILSRTDLNGGIETGGTQQIKISHGASGSEYTIEVKSPSERESVILALERVSKAVSEGKSPVEAISAWNDRVRGMMPDAEVKGTQAILFSIAMSDADVRSFPPAYKGAIGKIRNEHRLAKTFNANNPGEIVSKVISEEAVGIQRQRIWVVDYQKSGGRLPADPAAWKRLDAGYIEMLDMMDGNPGMIPQEAASNAFHGTQQEIHFSMGEAYNFPGLRFTRHDDVQLKTRMGKFRELEPGMQLTREGAESATKDAVHDVALARLLINRYLAGTATAAEAKVVESVYGGGAKALYGKGRGSANILQENTLMNSSLIALDMIGAGSRSFIPAAPPQAQSVQATSQAQAAPVISVTSRVTPTQDNVASLRNDRARIGDPSNRTAAPAIALDLRDNLVAMGYSPTDGSVKPLFDNLDQLGKGNLDPNSASLAIARIYGYMGNLVQFMERRIHEAKPLEAEKEPRRSAGPTPGPASHEAKEAPKAEPVRTEGPPIVSPQRIPEPKAMSPGELNRRGNEINGKPGEVEMASGLIWVSTTSPGDKEALYFMNAKGNSFRDASPQKRMDMARALSTDIASGRRAGAGLTMETLTDLAQVAVDMENGKNPNALKEYQGKHPEMGTAEMRAIGAFRMMIDLDAINNRPLKAPEGYAKKVEVAAKADRPAVDPVMMKGQLVDRASEPTTQVPAGKPERTTGQAPVPIQEPQRPAAPLAPAPVQGPPKSTAPSPAPITSPGARMDFRFTLSEYDRAEEISANLADPNKAVANGGDRGLATALRADKNLPPPGQERTDFILRKMRENETGLSLDQLGARGVLRFEKTGGEMDVDLPVMLPPTYVFIVSTSWGNVKVKVDGNLEGENLLKAIDQETSKQKKTLAAYKMSQAEALFKKRLGVPMRQDIGFGERDASKPLNKALKEAAPMPQGHKPRESFLAEGWEGQRVRSGMVKIVGGDLDFILTDAWDSRTNSIDERKATDILAQRTPRGDPEYARMYANALIEAANRIGKERDPKKIAQESVGIVDNVLLPRQPPDGGGPGQGPRGPGGRGPGTEGPSEQGGARVIPIGAARGARASVVSSFDDARTFVNGASKEDLDSLMRADPSLKPQIEAIDKTRSEAAKKVARNSLSLMLSNMIERGVLRIEKSEAQGQMDGTTNQATMVTTYRVIAEGGGHAQEGAVSGQTPQGRPSGSVSVRPGVPRPSDVRELGGPRPAAPSEKPAQVKDIFELRHLFGNRTGNRDLEAAVPKGEDTTSLKISRTARALDRIASRPGQVELPPDIQQAIDRIKAEKDKARASGRKNDLERVAILTVDYATRLVNAEVEAARSGKPAQGVFNDRSIAAKIEKAHGSADLVTELSSMNPTERFAYDLALARARQNGRTQPISADFSGAAIDAMAWHNKKDNVFSVSSYKGVPLSSELTGAPHIDIRVLAQDGNTAYTVRVSGDKVEIIDISGMKFRNDVEKEAFIRYANSRMTDFSKSFGGQKEISDSLQKIMEHVRNGNIGTAMRFAQDLGDAVAGSKARAEASRPADPEASFKILSRENVAPIPPQKAQAFRDFARMDADDKVALIEMLLDTAKAEERKGSAAANVGYITRLRAFASHLLALRTLNGETGMLLERALGLRPGGLSAIYLNPAIFDPHAEFFKIIQRSGLISIKDEGVDVHVYPGTKLKDTLVGMMTSGQGNLILTLLKMYPDAKKIEMRPAGGLAGVTKVRITDSRGMHYEYIKPVDLQAAATGDENLQRSWVPTADTMTRTPDQKEDLTFRLPNGSRSRYGISRSITNSRIEIAGVTLETAFTSSIMGIKNDPEILKALGQHGDAFLEQLWFYITASLSSGAIDGHECNTFAMLMNVTNGNAQELRDRGFHFIPDGHGGEFVIMFGRIDTDDSAGSYWVSTDRHGKTDISSHIERSGGQAYLYRLLAEFVNQWNAAHPGAPPITMKDLSDRMFRQPVTGPGGTVSEPPAIAGSRRWMRIRGNDPAFVQGMEYGFRSHSGESAGISFGLGDDASRVQYGAYGVAKGYRPCNGEPSIVVFDQAGRSIAVAEYESMVIVDEPVYRHLPKNSWSYMVEEIDMPANADRSHANGTFELGGKTFLSYTNINDIPPETRDRSYAVHTHPDVGDSAALAAGGMAFWVVPRKSPGASGALRLSESLGFENYPMRGTIPSFRVMTSGGEVGAVNRAMRLGEVLDRTIASTPSTP